MEDTKVISGEEKAVLDAASGTGNANNRTIFRDATLTSQFLREYSGISLFANVKPEDIEDVTAIYHAYLGIEFESDTVKKVRVEIQGEPREVYVIPLIEHKSYVDYDVSMQLLRYMVVIWHDYAKQQESLKQGASHRKNFRYPLIVPIVYYEGKAKWTADRNLSARIEYADKMKMYIPEFEYQVVHVHNYTNEELQKHDDEMSLVMMLNKIQTPEDYSDLLEISKEYVSSVYDKASGSIQQVYRDIFWSLMMKMNVPVGEAKQWMNVLEADGMGYLFENMDKMDIQAERENTRIARAEADAAKAELAKAAAKEKEAAAEKELSIQRTVLRQKTLNHTKEEACAEIQFIFELDEGLAKDKVALYWNL